jgi:hypothetical protein
MTVGDQSVLRPNATRWRHSVPQNIRSRSDPRENLQCSRPIASRMSRIRTRPRGLQDVAPMRFRAAPASNLLISFQSMNAVPCWASAPQRQQCSVHPSHDRFGSITRMALQRPYVSFRRLRTCRRTGSQQLCARFADSSRTFFRGPSRLFGFTYGRRLRCLPNAHSGVGPDAPEHNLIPVMAWRSLVAAHGSDFPSRV